MQRLFVRAWIQKSWYKYIPRKRCSSITSKGRLNIAYRVDKRSGAIVFLCPNCEKTSPADAIFLDLHTATVQTFLDALSRAFHCRSGEGAVQEEAKCRSLTMWSAGCGGKSSDVVCAGTNPLRMHIDSEQNEEEKGLTVHNPSDDTWISLIRLDPRADEKISQSCSVSDLEAFKLIDEHWRLKAKLTPLDSRHIELQLQTARALSTLSWVVLHYMGFQFGFLFQLIWVTYSWDIMEPVTYFVTFANSIAAFAFVLLTRTDAEHTDVAQFVQLRLYHYFVRSSGFPLQRYHELKNRLALVNQRLSV